MIHGMKKLQVDICVSMYFGPLRETALKKSWPTFWCESASDIGHELLDLALASTAMEFEWICLLGTE